MFERFTAQARQVMDFAQQEAHRLKHDHIGTEHLLLGLTHDKEESPAKVLATLDVKFDDVIEAVLEVAPEGDEDVSELQFTAELKKTLEFGLRESLHLRDSHVNSEHLLIGVLRNGESMGSKLLRSLIGDLNLVIQQLLEEMSWYTGRVVEEDGVKKPIMEYPDIRPLDPALTGQSRPRPKKRRARDEAATPEWQPIRPPDFHRLVSDGIEILEHGLPELPKTLDYSQSVPLAYWSGEVCGTVLFLYYLRRPDGSSRPCGFSGTYVRVDGAWQPREGWSPNDGTGIDFDPITSFQSADHGDSAIHWTGARRTSEPAPDEPAILISGRHSPEVAEIQIVQGEVVRRGAADGHFGFWTMCSEASEPFRIESYGGSGTLIDVINEPFGPSPSEPQTLEVITPTDAELVHRYGGQVQILKVERHEESVKVEWRVTLEPDLDAQLAEQLELLDREPDPAWSQERIEDHIKLIDVIKLTVLFSNHVRLTDDLGTVYQSKGGTLSTKRNEATHKQPFEPAIPKGAANLTVHWEDLAFEIPLR